MSNTSNLVVPLGSSAELGSGYDATDTSVFGSFTIDSGATANRTAIHDGGYEIVSGHLIEGGYVYDDGSAIATTVDANGELWVSGSGATATGTLLNGEERIFSGAVVTATQVGSGGEELVQGGSSLATSVGSGGVQDVSYGTASGTVIASGGAQYVFLSGSAASTVVDAGGLQEVGEIGGKASGTHVLSGGLAIVLVGGVISVPVVDSGGALVIEPGGTVSGATGPGLVASTGVVVATRGEAAIGSATLSGITLSGAAVGIVLSGGRALGFTVDSGTGGLTVYGSGLDSGSLIASGGSEYLSGGTVSGDVVSGGTLNLQTGVVNDTTVIASGLALLYASGSVARLTIGSGGVAETYTRAVSGTQISAGGIERVYGVENGAIVSSGGILEAENSGTASGSIVSHGGTLNVTFRGSATGTVLSSGGAEIVSAFGSAHATTLATGGLLIVEPGAFVDATVLSGGTVMSTGAFETLVENPQGFGGDNVVLSAWVGSQSGAFVASGDALTILPSGVESGATFYAETILSGGRDVGGTDFGFQAVSSGGVALGTHVQSGAQQFVGHGGSALATVVSSGGSLNVDYQTVSGIRPGVDATILAGGTLVFDSHLYSSGLTASIDSANVLTLHGSGYSDSVQLDGTYTGETFSVVSGPYAEAAITVNAAPCYCPGTLILTEAGERPVETLAIGDGVVTASGAVRPIQWIGRRSYARAFAANNPAIRPVLITAGALGDGLPKRDLWVSPLHAMFIDGVLVPARLLLNGRTIRQPSGFGAVHYIHVELASHDVLLAEGAPSESFVDDDSRAIFYNAAEFTAHPPTQAACYCAPRLDDMQAAATIRRRLAGLNDGERLAS